MGKMLLPEDFKEFLRLLNSKHVDYLLVGGYAVGYHGYPRATVDMDIWVAVNRENANKTIETLVEFGFSSPEVSVEVLMEKDKVIRMGVPPFRIEILTTIDGVDFDDCFKKRVVDRIDDVNMNIINREHLLINKKASGRFKDLNDLEQLSGE
jgi:hypothetical protein